MEFREIDEEEFLQFLNKHPLKNFLQSPNMAKIREKSGQDIYYVGVFKDSVLVAATFMAAKSTHFGRKDFYAPRGLLVDYKDKELLAFFTMSLKKFIKRKKGYVLRIDPYYILKQRDINGDVVEDGIDNTSASLNLLDLGYRKNNKATQVTWTFVLDLDKTEEELLKNMRSFTRRNIQKGIKNKIIVREARYDELEIVKEILDATCERKHFMNRDLKYFQDMYNAFKKDEQIQFIIAEIDTKKMLEDLDKEKKELKENLDKAMRQGAKEDKIKKHKEALEKVEKEIEEVNKIREQYGDIIPASTGVFMTFGDEVLYLFGGNKKEFMHFGTPYVVQWEMIKYGLKHNFKRYNFYGISGNFDKNDKDYGIYDFKKGFTGYVEELIGEYCYPVSLYYYVDNIIKRIKK